MRYIFIADAHLQPGTYPQQNKRLEATLEKCCDPESVLILLGDTFHTWFERKGMVIGNFSDVFSIFHKHFPQAKSVHLITGNRDFAFGKSGSYKGFFHPWLNFDSVLNDTGLIIEGDSLTLDAFGKKILCRHGDSLCTADRGYQFLRWLTQGLPGKLCMSYGPSFLAKVCVGWLQHREKKHCYFYPITKNTIQLSEARTEIENGADILICGHIHHMGRMPIHTANRSGELIVVPPFMVNGAYCIIGEYGTTFPNYY